MTTVAETPFSLDAKIGDTPAIEGPDVPATAEAEQDFYEEQEDWEHEQRAANTYAVQLPDGSWLVLRPPLDHTVHRWDVEIVTGNHMHTVLQGSVGDNDTTGVLAQALCHGSVPEGLDRFTFCCAVLELQEAMAISDCQSAACQVGLQTDKQIELLDRWRAERRKGRPAAEG